MSASELADILSCGALRPGPPSFQGKWFAESGSDAARWGRQLYRIGQVPFHLIEVELPDDQAATLFRLPILDGIGPARFAEPAQLGTIQLVQEIVNVPTDPP